MPELIFATSNAHKVQEVAAMLGTQWQVQGLRSFPQIQLPEETGTTFEANAILKAEAASAALPGHYVIADDSGLEVDALGGEPGVYSARYAGPSATDADNRARLKTELGRLTTPLFPGRFRCCLALALNGRTLHVTHGTIEGILRLVEQGEGGFGYDPLFQPDGFQDTFGVLPSEVKNQLSHRARALGQLKAWMEQNLA
ncbi:MAG: dITP/XTP pyrophosphatase [Prosthecobacter sp.]|nr:dITP/XTP pyrophosphatase [Prosthecobacter sp.]